MQGPDAEPAQAPTTGHPPGRDRMLRRPVLMAASAPDDWRAVMLLWTLPGGERRREILHFVRDAVLVAVGDGPDFGLASTDEDDDALPPGDVDEQEIGVEDEDEGQQHRARADRAAIWRRAEG